MLKTEIKKVKVEKQLVMDCICNRCGESLKNDMGNYEGIVGAHGCGGYGSKIGDGLTWRIDICESCLLEYFKDFKISPYEDDQ